MREVEEMLVRGVSNRTIYGRLAERWGCKPQSVRIYVDKVRRAWAVEAQKIDRTELRAQHRARLTKVLERAMTRRMPVRNQDGTVVLDLTGNVVTADIPDLRTGMRALDSLAKLDNLNDETVKLEGADNLVDLMRMGSVMAEKAKAHERGNGRSNGSGNGAVH